jgi:hypothetical protein
VVKDVLLTGVKNVGSHRVGVHFRTRRRGRVGLGSDWASSFLSAGLRDGVRRVSTTVGTAKRRRFHYWMVTVGTPIESAYHGALFEETFFPDS